MSDEKNLIKKQEDSKKIFKKITPLVIDKPSKTEEKSIRHEVIDLNEGTSDKTQMLNKNKVSFFEKGEDEVRDDAIDKKKNFRNGRAFHTKNKQSRDLNNKLKNVVIGNLKKDKDEEQSIKEVKNKKIISMKGEIKYKDVKVQTKVTHLGLDFNKPLTDMSIEFEGDKFNIVNKYEVLSTQSLIGRILPNGKVRTVGKFWCPKNVSVMELGFSMDIDGDLYTSLSSESNMDSGMLYVLPTNSIRYVKHESFFIVECFMELIDNAWLPHSVSIKTPFISKNEKSKFGFESKTFPNETFMYVSQPQVILVFGPKPPTFAQCTRDDFEDSVFVHNLSNLSLMSLSEGRLKVAVNTEVDMEDKDVKDKWPYFIQLYSSSSSVSPLGTVNTCDGLNVKYNECIIYPSFKTIFSLNSRFSLEDS